ncbi:hypothetical protein [Uliginosibacterium sp. TH139]|uniref:hypothetical protein n=1 Tax=Uliginosibacterium sp. TH139 TaxID=2067453 RepID=UPI00117BF823|nr:hypothetical protein [Uliginosibacterium sp. TH139]
MVLYDTSALSQKLNEIPWDALSTAYGNAADIPLEIERLFSHDSSIAKEASHKLWCGLCHQHAFVSSAALPALPFLLMALNQASDGLRIDILDILAGFAKCSKHQLSENWVLKLREELVNEMQLFERLSKSENSDVAEFSIWVCEELSDNDQT